MVKVYKAKKLRRHYIREHLEAREMSQRELADIMKTNEANISRWISLPERVDLNVISGVADALEMTDAGELLRPPRASDTRALLEAALAALPKNNDEPTTEPPAAPKPKRPRKK